MKKDLIASICGWFATALMWKLLGLQIDWWQVALLVLAYRLTQLTIEGLIKK
jgi:hypothetical protein